MRYFIGLVLVLALGVMGCSETTGDGGSGGDGGNGGVGGGVADCTGEEDGTPCGSGEAQGGCFEEACLESSCEGVGDYTLCWYLGGPLFDALGACVDYACSLIGGVCTDDLDRSPCYYGDPASRPVELGVCEGGSCVPPVEDCTGVDGETICTSDGRVGFCRFDLCVTAGCSRQEDGTYCANPVLGDGFLGVCEAEECTQPEDCTGIADGVNCTGADFSGTCEAGECVSL